MGGRSRYEPSYERARRERHRDEVIARGDPPQTLSDAEIERGEVPVTRAPAPVAVAAWVRYGATPVLVDGFTSTWTSRAVEVVWRTPQGEPQRAWVWANAVRRRTATSAELLGRRPPQP